MPNATSSFLQGVNAANAASQAQSGLPTGLDPTALLSRLAKGAADVATLAASLGASPGQVLDASGALIAEHLAEKDGEFVKLSEVGERAVRYLNIAKS